MSDSSSRQPFNAWTHGMPRWPRFWTRASPRLLRIFLPIYNAHPSSYSSISTLLIFQEIELVAFAFVDPSPVANAVTFQGVFSPRLIYL